MKEGPILFSGPMVRPTLSGAKIQTRRVMKAPTPSGGQKHIFPPRNGDDKWFFRDAYYADDDHDVGNFVRCPYGMPGDRLWVRETFKRNTTFAGERITYRADDSVIHIDEKYLPVVAGRDVGIEDDNRWRPSIFMPRWASRITLEIVRVRVQRLQEISEEDAIAEGMQTLPSCWWSPTWIDTFSHYWNALNTERGFSWRSNPWVWVLDFRKVKP